MKPGYDRSDFVFGLLIDIFQGLMTIYEDIREDFDLMLYIIEDQQGIGDDKIAIKEVNVWGMKLWKPLERSNQVIIRITNGSSKEPRKGIVGNGFVVGKEIFEDVERVPFLPRSKDFATLEDFKSVPIASKDVGRV